MLFKNRKIIVTGSKRELIDAIGDVALSLIKNKLPLTRKDRKEVKKHIKALRSLATSKVTQGQKKKILSSQKGGTVLGFLWNIIKNIV